MTVGLVGMGTSCSTRAQQSRDQGRMRSSRIRNVDAELLAARRAMRRVVNMPFERH